MPTKRAQSCCLCCKSCSTDSGCGELAALVGQIQRTQQPGEVLQVPAAPLLLSLTVAPEAWRGPGSEFYLGHP